MKAAYLALPALCTLAVSMSARPSESAPSRQCVVQALTLDNWKQFESDLRSVLNPKFIKVEPPLFDHVEVRGALSISLGATDINWLETTGSWDVHKGDFAPGRFVVDEAPLPVQGGLYASIEGEARGLRFDRDQQRVALALFEAMTGASDERTEHQASGDFDRSWTRIRRRSPNGRLVCQKVFEEGPGRKLNKNPNASCFVTGVTRSRNYSQRLARCL